MFVVALDRCEEHASMNENFARPTACEGLDHSLLARDDQCGRNPAAELLVRPNVREAEVLAELD